MSVWTLELLFEVLEEHTASIFRAEVSQVGIVANCTGWKEGRIDLQEVEWSIKTTDGRKDSVLIVHMGNTGHDNGTIRSTAGLEEVTTKWHKTLKTEFTKLYLKSHVESKPNQKFVLHQSRPNCCLNICWSSQILVAFSQAIQAAGTVDQAIHMYLFKGLFDIGWIVKLTMTIVQEGKWMWPTPSAPYRGVNKLSYKNWRLSQNPKHGLKLSSRCLNFCGTIVFGINCAVCSKAFLAVTVLAIRLVKTVVVQMVTSKEQVESKWIRYILPTQ